MNNNLILVTGATGKQGGAAVRHLLNNGFAVRALTRNTEKLSAQALKAAGVDVVKGDMENSASLASALRGAYGVFSVQNFWEKGVGLNGEIRQAHNLVEAAKKAGVRHFIQSSIAGCETAPGVHHFESKAEIEKLVRASGIPATFLRTVLFMENFSDPKFGKMMFAVLGGSMRSDLKMHMIAVDDIGWFVAHFFTRPEKAIGNSMNVAGDSLTYDEMRAVYARVTGVQPPSFKMPPFVLKLMNGEMARQLRWNNDPGWTFDLANVRRLHPNVMTLEMFLKAQRP